MIATLASLAQPLPEDPDPIPRPEVDWGAVAPVLILVGGALVLMLVSSFVRKAHPCLLGVTFSSQ